MIAGEASAQDVIDGDRTLLPTGTTVDQNDGHAALGKLSQVWVLVGLPPRIFPDLHLPGTRIGALVEEVRDDTGIPAGTVVTAAGSHDTASAVVAVPAQSENFAYISCGTWSLVGLELDQPVLSEEGRLANFTNEVGVDGKIRYLRNVMGLWLLQASLRTW